MEVILLQDVEKLGNAGDVVLVKPGYARNYLIPKGLAVEATPGKIRVVQAEKEQQIARDQKALINVQKMAEKIAKLKISTPVPVGKEDRVFGSVTAITIANLINEKGFNVDKKDILLDEPIRSLGVYSVLVKLEQGIQTEVKVYVIKE
ncbi:MAG: 50S ribosomal protein L9 [Candidatus Marinimicrobia bacterium]|nr:50S ribosomal protein L9 [Candidatus Neomarinimicrobiota bacterium]